MYWAIIMFQNFIDIVIVNPNNNSPTEILVIIPILQVR